MKSINVRSKLYNFCIKAFKVRTKTRIRYPIILTPIIQGTKRSASNPKILAVLQPDRGACSVIDNPRLTSLNFVTPFVYRRCQVTSEECFPKQ